MKINWRDVGFVALGGCWMWVFLNPVTEQYSFIATFGLSILFYVICLCMFSYKTYYKICFPAMVGASFASGLWLGVIIAMPAATILLSIAAINIYRIHFPVKLEKPQDNLESSWLP